MTLTISKGHVISMFIIYIMSLTSVAYFNAVAFMRKKIHPFITFITHSKVYQAAHLTLTLNKGHYNWYVPKPHAIIWLHGKIDYYSNQEMFYCCSSFCSCEYFDWSCDLGLTEDAKESIWIGKCCLSPTDFIFLSKTCYIFVTHVLSAYFYLCCVLLDLHIKVSFLRRFDRNDTSQHSKCAIHDIRCRFLGWIHPVNLVWAKTRKGGNAIWTQVQHVSRPHCLSGVCIWLPSTMSALSVRKNTTDTHIHTRQIHKWHFRIHRKFQMFVVSSNSPSCQKRLWHEWPWHGGQIAFIKNPTSQWYTGKKNYHFT